MNLSSLVLSALLAVNPAPAGSPCGGVAEERVAPVGDNQARCLTVETADAEQEAPLPGPPPVVEDTLVPGSRAFLGDATYSSDGPGVLRPGEMGVGIFAPLRVGIVDRVELSAHPIFLFLLPRVEARVAWLDRGSWMLSTGHSLGTPTPTISTLSAEGIGGIWPASMEAPGMVSTHHQVRVGLALGDDHRLTMRAGLSAALMPLDDQAATVDLALVYPRMAHWVRGFVGEIGVDFEGRRDALGYGVDLDLFLVPEEGGTSLHIEASGTVRWRMTTHSQLLVGVKTIYGEYPFGTQTDILPLVDVQWDFQAWGQD